MPIEGPFLEGYRAGCYYPAALEAFLRRSGSSEQAAGAAGGPAVSAAEVTALVEDRLREVEIFFRAHLESPLTIVDEIGSFVAESGGKRVRPTLHLLCSRLCGYDGPHDVVLATVLEFIHSATLIHDDIIDESTTRRGRPTVNRRWGNTTTVLFGDYLFAKAMELALLPGSLEVMRRLADITLRMTEGEMLQTRYVGRLDISSEQYFDLVERKTAALFGGCCELAGILAGVDADREAALRRYGISLGLAFQIVDDVLDLTGDPIRLGKPAGSDLREGKTTLPVIDLLNTRPRPATELVRAILASESDPVAEIASLTDLLHENGSIVRALDEAHRLARRAAEQLVGFPNGPARRALEAVPELLVLRDR